MGGGECPQPSTGLPQGAGGEDRTLKDSLSAGFWGRCVFLFRHARIRTGTDRVRREFPGASVVSARTSAAPSRDGEPRKGIDRVPRGVTAGSIPFLAISSVFKELFGRAPPSPYRSLGVRRSQGRGESNPVLGGVGDRSATSASPLGGRQMLCPAPKQKEPPPCGSGSLTVSGLSKVLVSPSKAPPWRGWPTQWLDWRTHASIRASSRATSTGFVPSRSAGLPGSESRRCTTC
jgi:hypothetical protein